MSKPIKNVRLNTEVPNQSINRSYQKRALSIQQKIRPQIIIPSSQIQKQKFSQQYAKLTKQFNKILAKSSTNRKNNSGSQLKKFFKANTNRDGMITEKNSDEKKISGILAKLQIKNSKLENLYSNKLHSEILQTVSKLQSNRRQKHGIVPILPSSSQQICVTSPFSPTSQFFKSPSESPLNKKGDDQIYVMIQQQKTQKINKNFSFLEETIAHFHNIYKIFELLQQYKNSYMQMIKYIKKYIMNHNKADINKLQGLLKLPYQKQKLKVFLCLEKIAIIGILDAMIRQNQHCVYNQGKVVLEIILGVYSSIIQYFIQEKLYFNVNEMGKLGAARKNSQNNQIMTHAADKCLQSLKLCHQLLQCQKIQPRKDLQSTAQFLYKKFQNLFKLNVHLFHKIKQSLISITKVSINNNSLSINYDDIKAPSENNIATLGLGSQANNQSQGININRFFYFLLCEYAHHMNSYQNVDILKTHKNLLDFFVTCPSPHLVYSSQQDKITIVLQFEGTIAMVKSYNNGNNSNKISIKLRPYALQLVKQITKKCQVVIMTTLMPQNIPLSKPTQKLKPSGTKKSLHKQDDIMQYEQLFKLSTCILFRYHYVRYRGLLIKDISRLGRKMEKVLLVDSIDSQAFSSNITVSPSKNNPSSNNLNTSNSQPQNNTNSTIAHSYIQKNTQNSLKSSQQITHLAEHLSVNLQNTIPITTWKGSQKDQQLMYLKQLLLKIISEQPTDVRTVLKKYKLVANGVYGQQPETLQNINNISSQHKIPLNTRTNLKQRKTNSEAKNSSRHEKAQQLQQLQKIQGLGVQKQKQRSLSQQYMDLNQNKKIPSKKIQSKNQIQLQKI